jgi:hypothetical protein
LPAAFLAGRTLLFERAALFIPALMVVSIAFELGFIRSLPKQKLYMIRSSTRVVKDLRS